MTSKIEILPPDPDEEVGAPERAGRILAPRRSLGRRIAKTMAWVLLLAVLCVVGYGAYIAVNVAKISTAPLNLAALPVDEHGRTNVLVIGVGDPGHSGEKLTDSLMVLSVDGQQKRVAQISLPRDLRVSIPGYGQRKINAANALGGIELTMRVVSETLDIPLHYYVKTDFTGFKQLVDAAGGVDVDVKERLKDTEYPCDDNQYKVCGLDIMPGVQHMDGTRALQYARCRKGTCGNDFGRAERQQEVVNLVRDKLVRPELLLNPARLSAVVAGVQAGIRTDMSAVQMLEFARGWQQARDNGAKQLVLSTGKDGGLRNVPGTSDLAPVTGNFGAIQAQVQELLSN